MTKVYYCPKCHKRIPFDKHYILVVCSKCGEEMFEQEDYIKNQYKVVIKE